MIPQPVLDCMARGCRNGCGVSCGDRPCDSCMAGGVCDASKCHCDDEEDAGCSEASGHEWVINEESDRCYCTYCGADGDA